MLPTPGVLSSHIRPPNSPTMRRDSVRPRPVPSSFGASAAALLEGLEDPLLVLGRHPDAGVGHRDHEVGPLAVGADGHAAAVGGELDGVGEQVEHHLLEPQLVGLDRPDVVGDVDRDGDGVRGRPLADHGQACTRGRC